MPDCSKAIAKKPNGGEPTDEETAGCQILCISLKGLCIAGVPGTTYKDCFIDPFQDPAFSDKCTFKPGTEQCCCRRLCFSHALTRELCKSSCSSLRRFAGFAAGKGILFCKGTPSQARWKLQASVHCTSNRGGAFGRDNYRDKQCVSSDFQKKNPSAS